MAVASAAASLMVLFASGNLADLHPARATNVQPLFSPSAQYGKLPMAFIANAGQTDAKVRFQVRNNASSLFFAPNGVTLSLPALSDAPPSPKVDIAHRTLPTQLALRLSFEAANANVLVNGTGILPGIANFFIGSDPSQWVTNVPTYAGVVYHNLYPGIDLQYTSQAGLLKGTYTIAAATDPSIIRWRYVGADHETLDPDSGDLHIDAPAGITLIEKAPTAWQERNGSRFTVKISYRIAPDGMISFAWQEDSYDPALPLTIDPGLDYSTYLGGNNTDYGSAIAVDANGNAYVTGYTLSSNFPTLGGFQNGSDGGYDAFVSKLNGSGTALIYSSYLGGSGNDKAAGIAVDASGNAYIIGETTSSNYPTTSGSYQPQYNALPNTQAAFVTKLNAAGNGLVYSTFLGGTIFDNGNAIAVDGSGNAYVTGQTAGSFPTSPNAPQTAFGGGGSDAFVTKLNAAGTALGYSTYLGGNDFDQGNGIAIDSSGNAYITGQTTSTNFPLSNAFQGTLKGTQSVFVTKVNAAGNSFAYSTYLGGSQADFGSAIALDSSGNAYITGYTQSTDFPITNGVYQTTFSGAQAVFVTKLVPAGNALSYSTFLGGNVVSSYDAGYAIGVDSSGNAYVAGQTSGGFPTSSSAYQTTAGGGFDAFISKLSPTGTGLLYSTYLGGSGSDIAYGLALDNLGNVFVTGRTSGSFPTSGAAYQTVFGGLQYDAFVSEFSLSVQPRIDTIGIYRNGTFYLRLYNSTGYGNIVVNYNHGSQPYPIVGDWYGVGYDTIGVFDQSTGQFSVCNANNTTTCSNSANTTQFILGDPGDTPLAGRWTSGALHVGPGVFRPSNGLIYLRKNLTTGYGDYTMILGIPGDIGLSGDWNGDGVDSPGVYRPSTITYYLTDVVCNCATYGSYQFKFGVSGDAPVVGDWIGQGATRIGLFRQTNGYTYLRNELSTGFADITFVYGIAGDKPVAGHWQELYPPAPGPGH